MSFIVGQLKLKSCNIKKSLCDVWQFFFLSFKEIDDVLNLET